MLHPIYTTSFADREMFAHNSYRERQQRKLDAIAPEQRIKYCFEFLKSYVKEGDDDMAKKCYDGISKWIDRIDDSEFHY